MNKSLITTFVIFDVFVDGVATASVYCLVVFMVHIHCINLPILASRGAKIDNFTLYSIKLRVQPFIVVLT